MSEPRTLPKATGEEPGEQESKPDRGRLLYIVNEPGYFLSHRLELALAAERDGWRVEVATAAGPKQADIRAAGLVAHSLPLSRSGLRPDQELRALLATYKLLRQRQPRLLHCVTLKTIVLGGLAALAAGVPARIYAVAGLGHVFTDDSLRSRLLRLFLKTVVRLIVPAQARLIVQNADDRDRLVEGTPLAARTVLIRGSGVDLERFQVSDEPPEPVRIVLPSRMIWKKGVGEFVEAGRRLRAGGVTARLQLAGASDPGNPAAVPEEQLQAWHDEGVVEWLGHCGDMSAVLRGSHIVCLPSYYGEGVPKSLIEGAASGRAIVTTDMPGCRDVVRDGENGCLVPPRDVEALTAALRGLIEDPDLRRRYGACSRQIAEQSFGLDRVIDETLTLYRALAPDQEPAP